jgi:hypothetical protein
MNPTWILIFVLANSDQILVNEMPSERACQEKAEILKKQFSEKIKFINCEQGTIMDEEFEQVEDQKYSREHQI